MPECQFPLCKRFAQKNGMCVNHSIYAKLIIEPEEIKPIAKKSKSMTINHKEYKKIVIEMLLKSKKCEIHSPVCSKIAQGLHHVRKRGEFLLDRRYLKRACNNCNNYCEQYPEWAIEHGFSLTKFSPIDKV